jgi:hypothetical protein
MSHEILDRDEYHTTSSDRSFGLVFGAVFIVIALLPILSGGKVRFWAFGISGTFLLLSLLRPSLLSSLNQVWTKVGLLLHRIVSPVMLALLFFGVLTPFAAVMRLLRKDALCRNREPALDSYWIEREAEHIRKQSMKNQF